MLRAFSPQGRVDLDTPFPAGAPWRIRQYRLNLKRYPVVGAAQRGIDAMLGLREAQAVDPQRVRALVAHVSVRHAAVMPYHLPQDALQAKFSLEFALCCALVHGQVGFAELRDEVVREPLMQRLMSAVRTETTEDFEPGWRDAAPFDQVFVHLDDGRVLASPQVRRPLGHADRPLDAAQVGAKFMGCIAHAGIGEAQAGELLDALWSIGTLPDVRALPWPLTADR
jgi:2-methylcitrate dehydratase PrpD